MATLQTRLATTRRHVTQTGSGLIEQAREAGDGLAELVRTEARDWSAFVRSQQRTATKELSQWTSWPKVERRLLLAADATLVAARSQVAARLEQLDPPKKSLPKKKTAAKAVKAKTESRADKSKAEKSESRVAPSRLPTPSPLAKPFAA